MITIENTAEILLLNKLLLYVKFKASDDESTYLSNSPILNVLMDKVNKATKEIGQIRNLKNSNHIRDYPAVKGIIKEKIKNIEGWAKLSTETKQTCVKTLVYPYEIDDTEVSEILNEI